MAVPLLYFPGQRKCKAFPIRSLKKYFVPERGKVRSFLDIAGFLRCNNRLFPLAAPSSKNLLRGINLMHYKTRRGTHDRKGENRSQASLSRSRHLCYQAKKRCTLSGAISHLLLSSLKSVSTSHGPLSFRQTAFRSWDAPGGIGHLEVKARRGRSCRRACHQGKG